MKTFGPVDARSKEQLLRCFNAALETAQYAVVRDDKYLGLIVDTPGIRAALMADHHPGYSMPIGGVLGLEHHVGPGMVGYDIGCGNLYAETNVDAKDVDIPRVMDEIARVISFGMGRNNDEPVADHPVFARIADSPVVQQRALLPLAQRQLGTVGSGNHYVDLFENRSTGRLGVGVHFGSRGLGHKTASGFLAIAEGKSFEDRVSEGEMDAAPLLLDVRKPSGQDYIEAMNIALEYAYAGREWVVERIVRGILGATTEWSVHNNHNEARRETHGDVALWVHRKGATPAFPGTKGFVGATMGEDAVLVEGVDTVLAAAGLYSTVHGAGRVMSRTQAAGKFKKGVQVKPGLINFDNVKASLREQGIELRGGGADEAPAAYKRLNEVLQHHEGAIRVLTQLKVLGVAMAGREVFDAYKD